MKKGYGLVSIMDHTMGDWKVLKRSTAGNVGDVWGVGWVNGQFRPMAWFC